MLRSARGLVRGQIRIISVVFGTYRGQHIHDLVDNRETTFEKK